MTRTRRTRTLALVAATLAAVVTLATPVAADVWRSGTGAPVTSDPLSGQVQVGQEHPAPAVGVTLPEVAVPCQAPPVVP